MGCIGTGTGSADILDDGMPDTVDVNEVKRLAAQGELAELPISQKVWV